MPPMLSERLQPATPRRGGAEPPPPSLLSDIGNRIQSPIDEDPDGVAYRKHKGYEPLIEALRDKGVDDAAMRSKLDVWGVNIPGSDTWDYDKIYDLAREYRLGDLKKDRGEFEAGVAARPGYQRRRAATDRSGRWWLELPIGVVQSFRPEYGPLPVIGLPSKTILGAAGREALINTLFEGAEIWRTFEARETLGDPITDREKVMRLGTAAAGGAIFGAGGKVLPMGVDAARGRFERLVADNWDRLPAGLRERWGSAANVDGTALPDVFEALVGRENMSLDEKGAVSLLRREAELDAVNPFRPDGAGLEAHNAAVQRHVERVAAAIEGMRAPRSAPAAAGGDTALSSGVVRVPGKPGQVGYANDVYQFFRAKGLSDAQARGIAAGIHAESGSDHGIRGGYKGRAVGLGQWLGDRRAKLIARYGENPTRQQQLDFIWEELQGGDPGGRAVLAAGDEVAVLDAYIRKFMRPAPGPQTTGDLSRGMQALGRGGETMRFADGAGRGAADVDPEAAVRADLAERGAAIDAERAQLEAQRTAANDTDPLELEAQAARSAPDLLEVPPMPELRRDLFPDEESWRAAQAEVDAEALGVAPDVLLDRTAPEVVDLKGSARLGDMGMEDLSSARARMFDLVERAERDIDATKVLELARLDNQISLQAPSRFYSDDARPERANIAEIDEILAAPMPGNLPRIAPEAKRYLDEQTSSSIGYFSVEDGRLIEAVAARVANARGRTEVQRIDMISGTSFVQTLRQWRVLRDEVDAGGLTAAERASLNYEEPGLDLFADPLGDGARVDVMGVAHDLRAALDAGEPIGDVAFAARDGADETAAAVLTSIDAEEAALAALRACL